MFIFSGRPSTHWMSRTGRLFYFLRLNVFIYNNSELLNISTQFRYKSLHKTKHKILTMYHQSRISLMKGHFCLPHQTFTHSPWTEVFTAFRPNKEKKAKTPRKRKMHTPADAAHRKQKIVRKMAKDRKRNGRAGRGRKKQGMNRRTGTDETHQTEKKSGGGKGV